MLSAYLVFSTLVLVAPANSIQNSVCSAPGVVPHPTDNTQFIICADKNGNYVVAETVPCPDGYKFSISQKTCVPPVGNTAKKVKRATGGTCKMTGPYCEGCDRMVVCANVGGALTALTNITCSDIDPSMGCSSASCSTNPPTQPCESGGKGFRCLEPGFFPDPTSCARFHMCSTDLTHYSGECDDQFDANAGVCTSTDAKDTQNPPPNTPQNTNPTTPCNTVVKDCTASQTPAKFSRFPSYYAICIPVPSKSRKNTFVYELAVAKCASGQTFDETSLACQFTCTGKRGRFPDPDNCKAYIECNDKGEAAKKTCADNLAFDTTRKLCLPEAMVATCQKTPREVPTTTSPAPVTPTPSPTPSTTNAGSSGFQCTRKGIFRDVDNCRQYIVCTPVYRDSGVFYQMSRRHCPLFTYYNPNGYCQFGLFCF